MYIAEEKNSQEGKHTNREWSCHLKQVNQERYKVGGKHRRDGELQTPQQQQQTKAKSNRHTPAETELRKR